MAALRATQHLFGSPAFKCKTCDCHSSLNGHKTVSLSPAGSYFFRGSKNLIVRVNERMIPSAREKPASLAVYAATEKLGFLGKLGRVLKEKAKSDIDRVFKGVSKTRENLAVVDELLTYWNLNEADTTLEELEEALLVADFGPKTAGKIVDAIRLDVLAGRLKTGKEIKAALKENIVQLLTSKVASTELNLGTKKPAVIMVVGVNGGGKTTTIGKLAHRFKAEGSEVLMVAGDTFRAAATEQLEIWAGRAGADIVMPESDKTRPSTGLHTNFNLMEELKACKRSLNKIVADAPHVVGVTGFVLTKLDGTSRGGCVVSVVDELRIPVKFVGVGEGILDLQPFDPRTFVDALFPS
eukprot:jgi/Mesen1/8985/ME000056S08384